MLCRRGRHITLRTTNDSRAQREMKPVLLTLISTLFNINHSPTHYNSLVFIITPHTFANAAAWQMVLSHNIPGPKFLRNFNLFTNLLRPEMFHVPTKVINYTQILLFMSNTTIISVYVFSTIKRFSKFITIIL